MPSTVGILTQERDEMSVATLIGRVRELQGCSVLPSRGIPHLDSIDTLPADVLDFYGQCGGLNLFTEGEYPIRVVAPDEFLRANPIIAHEKARVGDISDSWYIICSDDKGQWISIDCSKDRCGRCYDSFWDSHAVAGSCRVVALSFTELLTQLVAAEGRRWFWLLDEAISYGDAYPEE